MGNCSSCTCNDKNEVQTYEVQVDTAGLANGGGKHSTIGGGTG